MFVISAFILYSLLLLYCLHRAVRRAAVPLSLSETALAYGVKIGAGCLYGYLFLHYYHGDDTWSYHRQGLEEYDKLIHHPLLFLRDLTPASAIAGSTGTLQAIQFYIMDLEHYITIKLLAIFDVLSRGNYYINVVLFNAIVFWGHYWLFSLLVTLFPQKRKWLFIIIFLLPSAVFWFSGIRADGLLLLFMALLLLQTYRWLHLYRKWSVLYIVLALIGLLIFRSAVMALAVPPLVAWWLIVKRKKRVSLAFVGVYGIAAVLFFSTTLMPRAYNLPAAIAQRQAEFFSLKGNTRIPLDTLQPSVLSYARILPQAVNNTTVQPYLWQAKGLLQVAASLDNLLLIGLFIVFLWRKDPQWASHLSHPAMLAMFFFAISLYLLVGYTVPFPGAIARYKMLGMLMLYCWLIINTKLERNT